MKIIQFTCAVPQAAEALKQKMLDTINRWSRLSLLAADQSYTTQPFGAETWQTHTTRPLHWADWDAIYSCLGDVLTAAGYAVAQEYRV